MPFLDGKVALSKLIAGVRTLVRATVPTDSVGQDFLVAENPGSIEVIHGEAAVALLNPFPIELVIEEERLDDDNPLPNDEIIRYSGTELMMNVRIDDDPTTFASKPFSVEEWSGVKVYISVVSTLAPTHLRILAQFSPDYDGVDLPAATWWDFEEGLWASLGWEDTDTADIMFKNYYLPVAGESWVRFWAIGTGTGANDYFDVILRARKFRGPHGVAHA